MSHAAVRLAILAIRRGHKKLLSAQGWVIRFAVADDREKIAEYRPAQNDPRPLFFPVYFSAAIPRGLHEDFNPPFHRTMAYPQL